MMKSLYLGLLLSGGLCAAGHAPIDNPVKRYALDWTDEIKWAQTVCLYDFKGGTPAEKLAVAQALLAPNGGGIVYFPAGTYRFHDSIRLADGVILRGADPDGVVDARREGYAPPTRFEFPKYVPTFEGAGTPKETAFKGIVLADPESASSCGVVNIWINCGHIHFEHGVQARNRLVYGCVLQNAALIDEKVPDVTAGQHAWQRFTKWHQAAIDVYVQANALVANNRLPKSTDHFLQKGYVVVARDGAKTSVTIEEGVWFDYDNRAGICLNGYCIGGGGGLDPKGTPERYPLGFCRGLVISDNYIWSTGRTAIEFTGDGTVCSFNVIRFRPNVRRWTNTGIGMASGSSTNDNRAITARGWGYTVEGNDYLCYRNVAAKGPYYINDGEGIMHEGHCNSAIRNSRIINNKGNAYMSIFHTAGIDGLLIAGNDIRPEGPGTDVKIASIYVNANRQNEKFFCRDVQIINNITAGSGILIAGEPNEKNVIRGNRHVGSVGTIINEAGAVVQDNEGYVPGERKKR